MRLISQIEHPTLKISVFSANNRYIVQIENERYVQAYKFREDELENFDAVKKVIDEQFIANVEQNFAILHQNRNATMLKHFPILEDEFEEII